jgi:hypothetical protein
MSFDTCCKHVALICPWIESVIQRSVIFIFSYTANILVYTKYPSICGIYDVYHFEYTDCDKPIHHHSNKCESAVLFDVTFKLPKRLCMHCVVASVTCLGTGREGLHACSQVDSQLSATNSGPVRNFEPRKCLKRGFWSPSSPRIATNCSDSVQKGALKPHNASSSQRLKE